MCVKFGGLVKTILRLKVSTPNFMVYGELGRYPLEIDIKVRMISYWCKLIQGKQSKLSTIAYKLLYVKTFQNCKISAWINHIHKILNDSGMSYIWTLQNCISVKWLKLVIDQFKQIWNSSIETSLKGDN